MLVARHIPPRIKLVEAPSGASTVFDIDEVLATTTKFVPRYPASGAGYTVERHKDEHGRNKLVIRNLRVLATIQQRGMFPDEIKFEGQRPMWLCKWLKWSWKGSFPVTFEHRGTIYAWNYLSGNRLILSRPTAPDAPVIAWSVPPYLDQHRKTLYPGYLALALDAEALRERVLISSVLVVQWMQARAFLSHRIISISTQPLPYLPSKNAKVISAHTPTNIYGFNEDVITNTMIHRPLTDACYTIDELGKNLLVVRETSLVLATIRRRNVFPDEITFRGKRPMWLWRWLKWSRNGSFPVTFERDGTTYAWNRHDGNCITLSRGTTPSAPAIAWYAPSYQGCTLPVPPKHEIKSFYPAALWLSAEAYMLREYVLISCMLIVQRMRERAEGRV